MDIKGKRVLITGGPSGIGFALVTVLAHRGTQAVITGRRAEALEDAADKLQHAGIACSPVIADVSTEAGRAGKLETIQSATLDARFADIREALAEVVRDHTAL